MSEATTATARTATQQRGEVQPATAVRTVDAATVSAGTQPAIGDYAVIGDCRTAALVARDGSIDWLCLPRFDGPSLFARILDWEQGGYYSIRPVGRFTTSRSYVEGTNVLRTEFETDTGRIALTDALVVGTQQERARRPDPDHELLRRIEGVSGEVDVELVLQARPDYGAASPRLRSLGAFGITIEHDAHAAVLRTDLPVTLDDSARVITGRATVRAGGVLWASLSTEQGQPPVAMELGAGAEARLGRTIGWWREWLADCSYEGEYAHLVRRSALCLKLLAYPPSGAIIAAPTTSLPEQVGGSRNWDYRYCWLRDASMTMRALLDIGFPHEGEAFLGWLLHATRLTRPKLGVLYDVHGRSNLDERELSHLAGYRGSRPVRVGNRAALQMQLDVYGEVIAAAFEFAQRGGELDEAEASLLSTLGGTVCDHWKETDHGIWEVRDEKRHFTYSKAMCWVALDRLIRLHDHGHVHLEIDRARLTRERDAIRDAIEANGFDRESRSYVASFGESNVDASLLLLGVVGYVEASDDRMVGTLKRVHERLSEGDLLLRYRYRDGLPGGESAFGVCGFWEVELLAMQGRVEEARRRFEARSRFANDVGLFAEEIEIETGAAMGNYPQAFTHIGLISAALAIAEAEGRSQAHRSKRPRSTRAAQ